MMFEQDCEMRKSPVERFPAAVKRSPKQPHKNKTGPDFSGPIGWNSN